jgi:hypothetical protein
VAHACNPSYSGDRDQEDRGSKPVRANSSMRLSFEKNPSQKNRAGGVGQGVGPEFNPQYQKKKKKVVLNIGYLQIGYLEYLQIYKFWVKYFSPSWVFFFFFLVFIIFTITYMCIHVWGWPPTHSPPPSCNPGTLCCSAN